MSGNGNAECLSFWSFLVTNCQRHLVSRVFVPLVQQTGSECIQKVLNRSYENIGLLLEMCMLRLHAAPCWNSCYFRPFLLFEKANRNRKAYKPVDSCSFLKACLERDEDSLSFPEVAILLVSAENNDLWTSDWFWFLSPRFAVFRSFCAAITQILIVGYPRTWRSLTVASHSESWEVVCCLLHGNSW